MDKCYLQMRVMTVLVVHLDMLGEESWGEKTWRCDQKWK